jgi:acyl-coenzyme A synthetase/AMP-(fatty) acid ligase
MTIARVLAENPSAILVVDGAPWSSAGLLSAGDRLADAVSAQHGALQLLTVSSANPAMITAALVAAGRLRVPVLLHDPGTAGTAFGPATDVVVSDRAFDGSGGPVVVGERLDCHLATRGSAGDSPLSAWPADAILFQTSGSTAAPRAVVKSFDAVRRDSARIARHLYGDAAGPDVVCAVPVFHSYGFTHGLLAGLLTGATVVFRPASSSPTSLARATAQACAGTLIALPIQIHLIAAGRAPDFPAVLHQAVSAGAPIRADAVARVCRDFGFRLLNAYGASELGTVAIATMRETSPPGCVGEPMAGVDVRIDPAEGELLVRNDAFAEGYLSGGEVRPLPVEDGWYRTGDLAERDPGGLRITGRRGDVINIAGRKTRGSRLEAVLSTHPDVLEIQVIAVPDEVRGEVPVVRAVVKPGRDRPDLLAWSRNRLDAFEVPRQVEWLDRLPRSATGKLMYAKGSGG